MMTKTNSCFALGVLLTLTVGCGGDDETSGSGSGGSVTCDDRGVACYQVTPSGEGCVEHYEERLISAVASTCVDEGDTQRTYLPDGCPRNADLLGQCIVRVVSEGSPINTTKFF